MPSAGLLASAAAVANEKVFLSVRLRLHAVTPHLSPSMPRRAFAIAYGSRFSLSNVPWPNPNAPRYAHRRPFERYCSNTDPSSAIATVGTPGVVAVFGPEAFPLVVVDEFQDTNRVQRDLLYLLREGRGSEREFEDGAVSLDAHALEPAGLLLVGDARDLPDRTETERACLDDDAVAQHVRRRQQLPGRIQEETRARRRRLRRSRRSSRTRTHLWRRHAAVA